MEDAKNKILQDFSGDKISYLFMLLVGTYEMAALQQMGKIKNPLTDQIEKNLEQAQFSIELLDMLRQKTKGNLNEDENKFLENVLAQLKLNYVDELEKEKNPPKAGNGGANGGTDAGTSTEGGTQGFEPEPPPEGTQVT